MAQFFPETLIQEIMDKNDIVDVVSSYVSMKRSGTTLKGLCPFHKEKTPSFTVSSDKQLYYCFGCSNGGTVINFIMQAENLDFTETVKYLAERANVDLSRFEGDGGAETTHLRSIIYKINSESAKFFYNCLFGEPGQAAREYLIGRELSKGIINKFGIGYAPEGNLLLAHLRQQGFDDNSIIQSGVVVKNDEGNVYDRFRNRVIFPIIDRRKNIIGFGGRVLGDGIPKYLNSPETAAFNKSYNLFGLNFAKSTKDDYLILVEGYTDVISLHQNKITSAVATLGTALTPEQARLIKRIKGEVVIAYDSDEAGQKATKRAIELLAGEDVVVRVLTMGDCKDPDDYIKKHGKGAFENQLINAKVQIEYKISKIQEKYNLSNIDEKVKYINELAAEFAKIKSPVEREVYISKISDETGVSADSILSEVKRSLAVTERKTKMEAFKATASVGVIKNINPKKANVIRAQKQLLNLISIDKNIYKMTINNLSDDDFEEGTIRDLFNELKIIYESGALPEVKLIVAQASNAAEIAEILHDNQNITDKQLAAKELIGLIAKEARLKQMFKAVKDDEIPSGQKLLELDRYLRKEVGNDK
ncbi:MAG: DNA primase [Firmicutes bacterium]|nr:DNA primase [Bacillota bacterium]